MKYILTLISFFLVLAVQAQTIIVDQQTKDTVTIGSKDTTITNVIKIKTVTVKKYKEPTSPPIPVPAGYLSLPVSNPIDYSGRSNVVIENLRFENATLRAITLTGCTNITIRNCFFNKATEEAISAENCTGILVEKNLFNGVATAFYGLGGSNHRVLNNQNINSHTRTQGGRGNLVQLNGVGGTNLIESNVSVGFPGENQFEDHISLFNSSGVTVRGNKLVGGGPSDSGSGIMAGDYGGSNQVVENNILLSTGNAGIGVAGGSGINVRNNKIYGERTAVSNNPLYMWAQQGASCSGNSITGNFVNWTTKDGTKNNGWNAGNCSSSTYDPNLNQTISRDALGIPTDWNLLITFITPTEVLKIRGK